MLKGKLIKYPACLRDFLAVGLIVCVGLISVYFSPFGIADHLDNYSQDLFNKVAGRFEVIYPAEGQSQISVLLLTDETVDGAFLGKWPIPYSAHARILNNLLRYSPKAVVVDFLWLNQEKPGVEHLLRVLERYKSKNIPVYLSFRNQDEPARLWPELNGLVIPISPGIAVDPTDFVARNYSLTQKGLMSSAVGVYKDLFEPSFAVADAPNMQIFWGMKTNQQNAKWMEPGDEDDSGLDLLLEGFSAVKYSPPYTTTVLVRDLLNPTEENEAAAHADLAEHLSGRVVFYGGNITGVSDLVYTPTRQIRPGVYYHAMALDNLLSLKGRYKSKELKKRFTDSWPINGLLVSLIILIIPSSIIYLRHKRKEANAEITVSGSLKALPQKKTAWVISSLKSMAVQFALTRLPLFAWVMVSVLVCFYLLELSPSNWLGYFAFTELGFYLDNIMAFEKAATRK